ncbi:acyl-CoA dehydrogenase [Pseudooceanicola sp.]|uniref:acyl-CoA dehydrogenase n=1 Tax=Pseudooceanicola sp. TaxID=1914328 RepID=UPI00262A543F|nr:acyl-CoA dehydrogenase [Pseudooceanicola sp.]MDF1857160.1 acyl-CoA dehydrogenase [Pseudooceanicola sp.]
MPATVPMFPGDIYDSAARSAADMALKLSRDDSPAGCAALLKAADDMGWNLALLPEDRGGLGLGYEGLTAIAEACGAEGGPLALAGSACAVPELAALCPEPIRDRLDAALNSGKVMTAALGAMVEDQLRDNGLSLSASGDSVTLTGTLAGIDGAVPPDHLLVALSFGDKVALIEVTKESGASYQVRRRMDTRHALAVTFATPTAFTPLAVLDSAAITEVEARCALVAASEAIGAAGRALDMTIAYLIEREQFGVSLSSFQVLRHKTVDIFVACTVARGTVTEAVLALDSGSASLRDLALATLETRAAASHIGKEVVQLHGGVGMTDVLPAAKLARRLLMLDYEYGSTARTLAQLAGYPS